MSEFHPLWQEVGLQNRIDSAAMEAYQVGISIKGEDGLKLKGLSAQLVDLSDRIPFNDDRFYKVDCVYEEICKTIDDAKQGIKEAVAEEEINLKGWNYSLALTSNGWRIGINSPRATIEVVNDPVAKNIQASLGQKMDPPLDKLTKFTDSPRVEEGRYKRTSYYHKSDFPVAIFSHYNDMDGINESSSAAFYIGDFSKAKSLWRDVKNTLASQN